MERDNFAGQAGCGPLPHPVNECGPTPTQVGERIREMEAQKRAASLNENSAPQGYAYGDTAKDPLMTADQEARRMVRSVTRNVEQNAARLQSTMMELHYLTALFDALPSKMSYEAAQGLKILLRNYPS